VKSSRIHELKCWPEYFSPILSGEKKCELRLDDRGFRVGDRLHLWEWYHGFGYTGRGVVVVVTHIVAGEPWLSPGFVAMSFRVVDNLCAR
jgi:hypothetical protein